MAGFNVRSNTAAPLSIATTDIDAIKQQQDAIRAAASMGDPVLRQLSMADRIRMQQEAYNASPLSDGTPGGAAAAEARSVVAPMETPVEPFPQDGYLGMAGNPALTPQSTNMDLARTSQSSLATTNMFRTGDFNPETGDYNQIPETLEDKAAEHARQRSTLTDASALFNPELSPRGQAKAIMESRMAGAAVNEIASKLDGAADSKNKDELTAWADTMGNTISSEGTRAVNHIVNGLRSVEPGLEGLPAGLVILDKNGLNDPDSMQAVGTIMGLSGLVAAQQLNSFRPLKDEAVKFEPTGRDMEDARPAVNLTNSIAAAAKVAMDRAGLNMSMDDVRHLAAIHLYGEASEGNYIPSRDENGNNIFRAHPRLKAEANKIEYLKEALFGASNRPGVSYTTNVAGAAYTNPGSQTTKGSLNKGGSTAEQVKHILGQMEFVYNPKDVLFKEKQLDDLLKKIVLDENTGMPKFSESGFAFEAHVDEATYMELRNRLKPPSDFDASDKAQVDKWEKAKNEHASEEIQNKLESLKYDIETAKTINKVFRITHAHSTANHRYFEMTKGADALSSKYGVREMRNVAQQDVVKASYLFDNDGIAHIKRAAKQLFSKKGQARHDAFMASDLRIRSGIALMLDTTVNYYTAINPGAGVNIVKMSEIDIINRYTPEIAAEMAAIGKEFNEWLDNPDGATDRIKGLLYGMPRGEALGNKNLWDDMFRLETSFKNPASKASDITLSYLSFEDGNQNGIFFQGIFFGNANNVLRLGTVAPDQEDMRGLSVAVFGEHIEALLEDDPRRLDAVKAFISAAKKLGGFNSEMFRDPLMQNSYGMDASMFFDHVYDLLTSPKYAGVAMETMGTAFPKDGNKDVYLEMAHVLNQALETTLRKVVDQKFSHMMKNIGMYAAVLNTPLYVVGPDGDMMEFSPVGILPDTDPLKTHMSTGVDKDGNSFDMVSRGVKGMQFTDTSGNDVDLPIGTTKADPTKKKPDQEFYDRRTQKWVKFRNYHGGALARYFVVMPIQAIDGSVLGLTVLAANKGRMNKGAPVPASFVHDGINSSGSGSIIYRNAYNNIAIPQAIPEIAKFGEHLDTAIKKAKRDALNKASQLSMIGIGADGHFPALSAVFDEIFDKIQDEGSYNERFVERKIISSMARGTHVTKEAATKEAENAWDKWAGERRKILDEARKYGWKPEGSISEGQRAQLAVKHNDFIRLLELSEMILEVDGPPLDGNKVTSYQDFISGFAGRVRYAADKLYKDVYVRKHGISQMTPGGGKKAVKAPEPSGKAKDWRKRIVARDNNVHSTEKHSGETKVAPKEIKMSPMDIDIMDGVRAGVRGRDFSFEDLINVLQSTEAGTEQRAKALDPFFDAIESKVSETDTGRGSYARVWDKLNDLIELEYTPF